MPYPSPVTYPGPFLYPGTSDVSGDLLIAVGDLVLGAVDAEGVEWTVEKFEGWGSPGSTVQFTQRARGHGSTASEPFLESRFMTISGLIITPSHDAQDPAFDRLVASVTLDPFQLIVAHVGRVRNCMAQRQGEVIVDPLTDTVARYSILIAAPDPRKFGDLVTESTLLPSSSGGLVRPSTWPRTWSGVSNAGQVTVTNPGNTQAPVWLRIDGPVPAGGWTVTHVGKRQSLSFATSLALAAGEFVTVDMEAREVLAQGQSPRAGYVTSRGWFTLDPGENTIAFSAANYSATAQLTVTTRPAWS